MGVCEQRNVLFVIIFIAIFAAVLLILSSTAKAEEADDQIEIQEPTGQSSLLENLSTAQDPNGSWDNELKTTAIVVYTFSLDANYYTGDESQDAPSDSYNLSTSEASEGMRWILGNYNSDDVSVETEALVVIATDSLITTINSEGLESQESPDMSGLEESELVAFKEEVIEDLESESSEDGCWNDDVGDTALAIYALAETGDDINDDLISEGIDWLKSKEKDHSWGTVQDDAKAIMALARVGENTDNEIKALIERQRSDGSFGSIEDTAWAVIALSSHDSTDAAISAHNAMEWLRGQEYKNDDELALSAMAEQHQKRQYDNVMKPGPTKSGSTIDTFFIIVTTVLTITALTLLGLFARISHDDVLEGPRKEIYEYIERNPGENLADITKKLGLSSSSVRHHLDVLEENDKIVSHKNGKYRRFYVNKNGYSKYTNGNGYKHIISELKNNTSRRIVKFLLKNPGSNQKYISKSLNLHPSTINWHAKRLKEIDIVDKRKMGKEVVYTINRDIQVKMIVSIIESSPAVA